VLAVVSAIAVAPPTMAWAMDNPNPIATVSGSSMWPTLKKGDLVAVRGVDGAEDLGVGDIIAFRHKDGLAVHRIMSIEGEVITTKGDANLEEDPPIYIEQVIGKIPTVGGSLLKVPLVGYLSLLLGPVAQRATDILGEDDGQPYLKEGRMQPVEEYEGSGDRIAFGGRPGKVIGTVEEMAQGGGGASSGPDGASLGSVPELRKPEDSPSQEPQGPPVPVEDLNR